MNVPPVIEALFPMLGPPRTPKNQKKEKQKNQENQSKQNVRLNDSSPSSSIINSNETIYSKDNIKPKSINQTKLTKDELSNPNSTLINQSSINTSPINTSPRTLIVISFITRFPSKPNQGQGSELLFYKPKNFDQNQSNSHFPNSYLSKLPCQKQVDKTGTRWTFLFIEAETIEERKIETEITKKINELSMKSIKRNINIPDEEERLIKVRNSKLLKWNSNTFLVSVIYSLKFFNLNSDLNWIKLNFHSHYWSKINGFHTAIENDLVSTALAAVCFPVAFNVGFEEIAQQDSHTRSDLVQLKALDTLYLSVQAGYARDGFKFYPKSAEPLKKLGNSDHDFKQRIWAYWTEVLCWHLIVCRSIFKTSISYTLHKIMVELKPAVKDPKVNVEELEKIMVKAIGKEADRCRQSVDNIVNHTLSEILHNPIFPPTIKPPDSIHLITLGSSSATFGVLSQLVKHFVTQSRWRLNLERKKENTDLKITIGESRPLHEGLTLAKKLNELIKIYDPLQQFENSNENKVNSKEKINLDSNKKLKSVESFYKNFGQDHFSNDWYLDSNHQKVAEKFDNPLHFPPLQPNSLQPNQDDDSPAKLDYLLQQLEKTKKNQDNFNDKNENEKIPIIIEITTDAGLRTSLLKASQNGILLLSADRVLPNGDALCKLGSSFAAYTAHKMKQKVIILVRHDRIEPSFEFKLKTISPKTTRMNEKEGININENLNENENEKISNINKKNLLEIQKCSDDYRHNINQAHPLLISSLIVSWKSLFKSELVDFVSKNSFISPIPTNINTNTFIQNENENENGFNFNFGHFDLVKADWISFFITDSGILGLERVKEVSKTLNLLSNLLWEIDDDQFD